MTTPFAWLISLPLVAAPFVYLIGHWGNKRNTPQAARQAGLLAFALTWLPFILAANDFIAYGHLRGAGGCAAGRGAVVVA